MFVDGAVCTEEGWGGWRDQMSSNCWPKIAHLHSHTDLDMVKGVGVKHFHVSTVLYERRRRCRIGDRDSGLSAGYA